LGCSARSAAGLRSTWLDHVCRVTDLADFAVADHIDAAFNLLGHGMIDRR